MKFVIRLVIEAKDVLSALAKMTKGKGIMVEAVFPHEIQPEEPKPPVTDAIGYKFLPHPDDNDCDDRTSRKDPK